MSNIEAKFSLQSHHHECRITTANPILVDDSFRLSECISIFGYGEARATYLSDSIIWEMCWRYSFHRKIISILAICICVGVVGLPLTKHTVPLWATHRGTPGTLHVYLLRKVLIDSFVSVRFSTILRFTFYRCCLVRNTYSFRSFGWRWRRWWRRQPYVRIHFEISALSKLAVVLLRPVFDIFKRESYRFVRLHFDFDLLYVALSQRLCALRGSLTSSSSFVLFLCNRPSGPFAQRFQ